MFILVYLENRFVYPQSNHFPIIYGTRPFKTYTALNISQSQVYENPGFSRTNYQRNLKNLVYSESCCPRDYGMFYRIKNIEL